MHHYVELAIKTVREYITSGRETLPPSPLPDDFKKQAGVFVSIKKRGVLRGCIGTLKPICENLAEEIIKNALSAATKDSRFESVEEDELKDLLFSVDVLSEAEDISSVEELDPKVYGVIVTSGFQRAVLLPSLEGVDTPEQQIKICRQKGGIDPDKEINLQRFTVTRYK